MSKNVFLSALPWAAAACLVTIVPILILCGDARITAVCVIGILAVAALMCLAAAVAGKAAEADVEEEREESAGVVIIDGNRR